MVAEDSDGDKGAANDQHQHTSIVEMKLLKRAEEITNETEGGLENSESPRTEDLKLSYTLTLILIGIASISIPIMSFIAYKVMVLTKCKNIRINLLLLCMNFTLVADLSQ